MDFLISRAKPKHMFEGLGFSTSLNEDVFDEWMENGRQSKLGYKYLIIVWDEYDSVFQPVYVEDRFDIEAYSTSSPGRERLVSAYDLYSESRIL